MTRVSTIENCCDEKPVSDAPLVSILVPVRNEAGYIGPLLQSLLGQTYPRDLLEILVIDGMSDDGTRKEIQKIQRLHPEVRLMDNPDAIVSTGLNLGIRQSRGEVLIRVDGHAELEPDFVEMTVHVLRTHEDAGCVGGPVKTTAHTFFGKAAALALAHPLGIGDAKQRYEDFEGYDQNVQFPGFRCSVFDQVGLFDESLVRNQDDEFTFRLKQNGIRTFISRRIRYTYYVRETPGRLFRMYFQYGFWRIPVMLKHGRPTSIRQVVPLVSMISAMALIVVAVASPAPWYVGVILPACYALLLSLATARMFVRHPPSVALRFPLAVVLVHSGYAFGMFYGFFSHFFCRKEFTAGGRTSALTR